MKNKPMKNNKKGRREIARFDLDLKNRMQEVLVRTCAEIAEEYRHLHEGYTIDKLKKILEESDPRLEESHVKSPLDDLLAHIALTKVTKNLGKGIGYEEQDIGIPLAFRIENALPDNRVILPDIEGRIRARGSAKGIQGIYINKDGRVEVSTGIHIGPVDGNKNLRNKIKEMIMDIESGVKVDPMNYLPQACIVMSWIDFLYPERPIVSVVYDLNRADGGIVSAREVEGEYETFSGLGLQRLSKRSTLGRFDLISEPTIFIADFQHHYRELFSTIERYIRGYASHKGLTIDCERGTPSSTHFLRALLTGTQYILYFDARRAIEMGQEERPRIYDSLLEWDGESKSGRSEYRFAVLKLSNIMAIVPCLLGAGLEVRSGRGDNWWDVFKGGEIDFKDPRQNLELTIAAGHPRYMNPMGFNIFDATEPAINKAIEGFYELMKKAGHLRK